MKAQHIQDLEVGEISLLFNILKHVSMYRLCICVLADPMTGIAKYFQDFLPDLCLGCERKKKDINALVTKSFFF